VPPSESRLFMRIETRWNFNLAQGFGLETGT
jgi:hypothetical protein